MPAFADYLDLKFAVADHVGQRTISDAFPRLVLMAESQLNRKLRTTWQVTSGTLTFEEGAATLPADFLEMLHVYGLNGYQIKSGPLSDYQRPGSSFDRYEIQGLNITIRGFSGGRQFQYYAKLPTLTASASASNWLLEQFPDVYLYAVGLEAAKYLKDLELVSVTQALLDQSLKSVKIDDERHRWSNTALRIGGPTP
jgi:hypothetical protein